jgi:hypothetical protein
VDEIGIPYANQKVIITLEDGIDNELTTDGDGKLFLNLEKGTAYTIRIPDSHECSPAASSKTPSGQHFAANGAGP